MHDIPGALCIVASMKPGVHEEGQAFLIKQHKTYMLGPGMQGATMFGSPDMDAKTKKLHEQVDKVMVDAIVKCKASLAERVKKHGFIDVFFSKRKNIILQDSLIF